MSSTAKTLELLSYFTPARPEVGLSALCRLARRDKATTYRHLQALEEVGFVEQNPQTKHYRLGPALLQLAQVREATVPRKAAAEAALTPLAEATGETCHVSVLSGATVYALVTRESHSHSTRVIIDVDILPLHATASGLCALAFGPAELLDIASTRMPAYTDRTPATRADLTQAMAQARDSGFARSDRRYAEDTHSIAAPIFDHTGLFAGAVTVASVATRFTPDLDARVQRALVVAARDITRNWGGTLPASVTSAWARSMPDIMDIAS